MGCSHAAPHQMKAERWEAADRLFKGDDRWRGADAAYSTSLDDDRSLLPFVVDDDRGRNAAAKCDWHARFCLKIVHARLDALRVFIGQKNEPTADEGQSAVIAWLARVDIDGLQAIVLGTGLNRGFLRIGHQNRIAGILIPASIRG